MVDKRSSSKLFRQRHSRTVGQVNGFAKTPELEEEVDVYIDDDGDTVRWKENYFRSDLSSDVERRSQ